MDRDERYRLAHKEERAAYMREYRKRKKQRALAEKNPIRKLIRILSGGNR